MERITGCAPEHICTLFRDGCTGTVEMVNSRGIYLQIGSHHILLCHSGFGTVPNGVAVDGWDKLYPLLSVGQPLQAEQDLLFFSSVCLALQLKNVPKDIRICFPDKKALHAGIGRLLAGAKPTGLSSLVYPLFSGQSPEMNLYCKMALPCVRTLLQALKEENADDIFLSVESLLGLGPGLTPSGDDLLSGILYALRHSPLRDSLACNALTTAVRELAGERTSAVSADYLMAVSEDAPFDRMAAAWADPAASAADLMEIGSNSGTEMLLGLLCAGTLLN
ncbi:MAG: DUF2877 domain-containing protein [Oscillospiraceae bacterium]|nr:DUF2877 domain-containing protein [Oscillospiraceae bacterium]